MSFISTCHLISVAVYPSSHCRRRTCMVIYMISFVFNLILLSCLFSIWIGTGTKERRIMHCWLMLCKPDNRGWFSLLYFKVIILWRLVASAFFLSLTWCYKLCIVLLIVRCILHFGWNTKYLKWLNSDYFHCHAHSSVLAKFLGAGSFVITFPVLIPMWCTCTNLCAYFQCTALA